MVQIRIVSTQFHFCLQAIEFSRAALSAPGITCIPCADSEDPDQPAHPFLLVFFFARSARMGLQKAYFVNFQAQNYGACIFFFARLGFHITFTYYKTV